MIELYILFVILGVFVHETLHGIAYLTTGIKYKNIEFGVMWKKLTPYTYCSQSMSVWKYWYSLILPNITFLIITSLSAVATLMYNDIRFNILFMASFTILLGGIGDLYVIYKTRHISKNIHVKDSLTEMGCDVCTNVNINILA